MSFIEIYTVSVVHLTAIPAIAYPMVYWNLPWKKGPTGRALMNKARSLALLFAVAIAGYWWPFPGFDYVYAACVTYLGVAISYQLHVMWRLKRHAQHRERVLSHFTLHPERHDDEATTALRPDDARREARRLADEGCSAES